MAGWPNRRSILSSPRPLTISAFGTEIFRSSGSTIVFEMVREVGGANPTPSEAERLVLSEHRGGAIKSDVASRNCFPVARSVRPAKYDSLDQVDRDRRSHSSVTSNRSARSGFFNDCHEYVFHFTKTGRVEIDRLASAFRIRTRATLLAGRTPAGATFVAAATPGSFLTKQFKAAQKERPHPATFPVQLAEWCIKLHGVSRVQTMLDPFLGIGNSAVAAKNCGVKKFYRLRDRRDLSL